MFKIDFQSIRMMRMLWFNAIAILLFAVYAGAKPGDYGNNPSLSPSEVNYALPEVPSFLDDHGIDVLEMMKQHFDLSITYLYTGIEFGSNLVQRPGISKLLKEESDSHWADGISMLKKYMQRGGKPNTLHKSFHYSGKNQIDGMKSNGNTMLTTLLNLLNDSKQCANDLNALDRMTSMRKPYYLHDGEWHHYLEEKLEQEAERTRKLAGYVTDLGKMYNSGMALQFFDSNI